MINIVNFLTEQVNDWINADRQEKIVSFQILLAGIIFLIIICIVFHDVLLVLATGYWLLATGYWLLATGN